MTQLLFLAHPSPRTAAAKVTSVGPGSFVLDRSIFHPGTVDAGHAQPPDRGEVWLGGDKRWLQAVDWRRGQLFHRLDGAVPRVGDEVRCHLDVGRRETVEAAHTALHLVLPALGSRAGLPPARVLGGGRFRIDAARAAFSPQRVADALGQAQARIEGNAQVSVEHVVAADAARAGVRAPAEAQGTLRVVRVGDAPPLVCDGTFRARTKGMGRVVLEAARPRGAVVELRFLVRGA